MWLVGQWGTQLGFARALRVAFQQHHQFRWDPNNRLSKIFIYDEYPLVGLQYPAVIIGILGGPALLRGIGDEIAEDTGTDVSIDGATYSQTSTSVYSGNLRLNVSIKIFARSGYERAQIADWIVLFLRHLAPAKFMREGINIEDIQLGGQTEELVGSDPVYSTSLTVRCLTSFTREIPISVSSTVDAICLTGIFTTLPDGVTVGNSGT